MYTIKKEILRLDLNEFNFDFSSGYIDGSDQWLTPTEESYIGACTTIQKASDMLDRAVYVYLDSKNLILEYMYISDDDGCIKHLKCADFEGKIYEIDNDLYCPELAQILKDRIYEIKKEQE